MTFYLTVTAADKSDDVCGVRPSSKTSVNVSVSLCLYTKVVHAYCGRYVSVKNVYCRTASFLPRGTRPFFLDIW